MQAEAGESSAAIVRRRDDEEWPQVRKALAEGATLFRPALLSRYYALDQREESHGSLSAPRVRKLELEGTLMMVGVERYALAGGAMLTPAMLGTDLAPNRLHLLIVDDEHLIVTAPAGHELGTVGVYLERPGCWAELPNGDQQDFTELCAALRYLQQNVRLPEKTPQPEEEAQQ